MQFLNSYIDIIFNQPYQHNRIPEIQAFGFGVPPQFFQWTPSGHPFEKILWVPLAASICVCIYVCLMYAQYVLLCVHMAVLYI